MARSISPETDKARDAIARRFARARKVSGLSLSELAKITGIDRITLWEYENGRQSIPSERLKLLATAVASNAATLLNIRAAA